VNKLMVYVLVLSCCVVIFSGCINNPLYSPGRTEHRLSNPAELEFLVIDGEGNPLSDVEIGCTITVPNWPNYFGDPMMRLAYRESVLVTDSGGGAVLKEEYCINIRVNDVVKVGYIWEQNRSPSGGGVKLFPNLPYSSAARYKGRDNWGVSHYVLRMSKEDE